MEPIIHHKISDLYETLNLPVEQEIDFIILSIPDIHPQIPFQSPKLRADYFSFILTKDGAGTYFLDDNKFPFGSGSIYFTNPGHVKSYELYESNEAYIITLTENFLIDYVHSEIFSEFPFLLAEIVPPQTMTENEFDEFSILYHQLRIEFNKKSAFKNQILGNLVLILLLKIKEKFWLTYNPIEEGNRNSQIVKTFKQLLESEYKKLIDEELKVGKLQVHDFAGKLNLHPNYLNSVIKSKTGKTVNEWIANRTLALSKSLLLTSEYSAKEIAFKLGFSEPTHFGRFFKKHMGFSPSAFRKMNGLYPNN